MIKNFALWISLLLASVITTSCSDSSQSEHEIIAATSADNPPYEFIQDGKVTGLDIDVIEAIGKALDKKIVIKNLDFPGLFPALSSSNVELAIAAISITPERQEHFDFSDIYATSSMGVLYKDDVIKSATDLSGKIIGVQLGTTWEGAAKEIAGKMPGTIVRSLSNNLVLVEELKSGAVDAVILETAQLEKFIANNPELKSMPLPEYTSEFAIVAPKNSELIKSVNSTIDTLRKDGTLDKIKKRWLQ